MMLMWFIVFFWSVTWRTACGAPTFQEVHSSAKNSSTFCITVSDQEPANLTRKERINWKSSPEVIIHMLVRVTRLNEYIPCASKRQLGTDLLHLGSHLVEYQEDVTNGFLTLAVTMDGVTMEPQNCSEKIYASTAHFERIRVFAKGPLHFNWDETCPETTKAPSTLYSTTSREHSTNRIGPLLTSRVTRDAGILINNTLLLTTITPNPFSVTSTLPSDGITGIPLQVIGLPVWAWIVAGAVLVAVIVIAVSCCYACARNRRHKKQMKRRMDAERVKQGLLVDAKRMSYQEQMRWSTNRVDTGTVPAHQEFSMTTFSDKV